VDEAVGFLSDAFALTPTLADPLTIEATSVLADLVAGEPNATEASDDPGDEAGASPANALGPASTFLADLSARVHAALADLLTGDGAGSGEAGGAGAPGGLATRGPAAALADLLAEDGADDPADAGDPSAFASVSLVLEVAVALALLASVGLLIWARRWWVRR